MVYKYTPEQEAIYKETGERPRTSELRRHTPGKPYVAPTITTVEGKVISEEEQRAEIAVELFKERQAGVFVPSKLDRAIGYKVIGMPEPVKVVEPPTPTPSPVVGMDKRIARYEAAQVSYQQDVTAMQQRQDIMGMQQTIQPEFIKEGVGKVVTKPFENVFEHTTKDILKAQYEADKKIEEFQELSIKYGAMPFETPAEKIEREFVTGVVTGAAKFATGAALGLVALPYGVTAMVTQPKKVKERFVEPYHEKLKGVEERRETYGEFVERAMLVGPAERMVTGFKAAPALTAGEVAGALAVLAIGIRAGPRPKVKTTYYEVPATKTIVTDVAPRMTLQPQVIPAHKAPLMRTRTVFETKPVKVPRGLLESEVAQLELIQRPRLRQKSELLYKPEIEIIADSKAWVQAHVVKPKTLVIKTKLVPETLKPLRVRPKAPDTVLLKRQTITQRPMPLVLPVEMVIEEERVRPGVVPYTATALDELVKTQTQEMTALITTPYVSTKLKEEQALIQVVDVPVRQKQRIIPPKVRPSEEIPPPPLVRPIIIPGVKKKKVSKKVLKKYHESTHWLQENPIASLDEIMSGKKRKK